MVPSALIFLILGSAQAETLTGRVVGVTDGDTLTLLDATRQPHKIRLAGIDAPEKKQDFGQKAKLHLSELAYGELATANCRKRDRYRRDICAVRVKGNDVGLEQLAAGLAWWYRQYAKEQTTRERTEYEQAENDARSHRTGLWASPSPTPPWEWRHEKSANLLSQ